MATLLCAVLLLSGSAGRAHAGEAPPRTVLTVFAAASLSAALQDLGRAFESHTPRVVVRFNFAGSQALVGQLVHGARADLLATADEPTMESARQQRLLADRPVRFARNTLVVITPARDSARVRTLADLARPGLRLVLAAPTVPAGRYSRAALAALDGRPGFGPRFAKHALANLVSEEEDVRGVLAKVQLGEADAGIVYATEARRAARKVRVLPFPPELPVHPGYPIAPLVDAREPAAASAFVAFVRSREGQRILAAHGFLAADDR
jgi:molybdate transport system substrate-binding protein